MSNIRARRPIHSKSRNTERAKTLTPPKSSKNDQNAVESNSESEGNPNVDNAETIGIEEDCDGTEEEDNGNNETEQSTCISGGDPKFTDKPEGFVKECYVQKQCITERVRLDTTSPKKTTFNSNGLTSSSIQQISERKKCINNRNANENASVTSQRNINYNLMLGIVLLMISIGLITFYIKPNNNKNCSFVELQQRYPKQQPYLWKSLSVGIGNIINKRTPMPAVYLLVNDNTVGDENISALIKDIAVQSSSCFDRKTLPVEMNNDDFTSKQVIDNYGIAIEKFKMKIKESNVIVIRNLNQIPAESARALHTICDTHSPIAGDVVIFLTLAIPATDESPLRSVEETLIKLWGAKLGSNELDPLLTRVMDHVVALKN